MFILENNQLNYHYDYYAVEKYSIVECTVPVGPQYVFTLEGVTLMALCWDQLYVHLFPEHIHNSKRILTVTHI